MTDDGQKQSEKCVLKKFFWYTQGSKVFPQNGRRHFQNKRCASEKGYLNNHILRIEKTLP